MESGKSDAGKAEREKRLAEAPYVLAAVEIGWMPPGYVGPGVRLEYLRLLNRLKPADWAKKADVDVNVLGNWRSSRKMEDGFDKSMNGEKTCVSLCRLLAALPPQGIDMAWVLAGSGATKAMPTLEKRARLALFVLERLRVGGGDPVSPDAVCKRLGISEIAVFSDEPKSTTTVKPKEREAAIITLATHCAPWCSSKWLRTGVASPPERLRDLIRRLLKSSAASGIPHWSKPAWEEQDTPQWASPTARKRKQVEPARPRADEMVELSMTRGQAMSLAALVRGGTSLGIDAQLALLSVLADADVTGLTFGGLTNEPLSVDEFLLLVPRLRRGLPHIMRRMLSENPDA